MLKKLFTSESVGAGHPDKICDQISDAVLDECLRQDKNSRVACEVMASNRLIIIGGEITTKAYVDIVHTAWGILSKLGYSENDFTVISNVNSQSSDINQGIEQDGGAIGAGDQGIMFGFATDETEEFMPLPIVISHELMKLSEKLRREEKFRWAKSDMKAQVTVDYTNNKSRIETIVMSVQHEKKFNENVFKTFIVENIMKVVARRYGLNEDFNIYINPTGKFIIGGPIGDTGLTGRKTIVDTYGGASRHGGGAFSGKDYTKVDRSAAYAARWVAKNIVASGIAKKVEIQLSYAIGITKPISLAVNTFGTSKYSDDQILSAINKVFILSPENIIKELKLWKPIYTQTATFGHFGRKDLDLPWEKLNKVDKLKEIISR